ncbi:MAG TPA: glycosyltransferase family 4 protein [Pseudacidobacterium sp.]|nr:glycosyltransferase family 4 protein [Pseudacidobacterium sp.]
MRIFVNEFCGHPFQIQLSRELARRGHEVEHVYFAGNTSTPKGGVHYDYSSYNLNVHGLHITREFTKHSIRSRRAADIEYGEVVALAVHKFKPDVVISANMPLDGQKVLMGAAKRHDAKFIYWLQDVYSMAVRFVLARKLKLLAGIGGAYYEMLEKKLLRESDAIVCISDGFVDFVKGMGIDGKNIHMIENWSPLDEVMPTPKDNLWAREHGVSDKFCFMYSGTLGMKHRPELLLELAQYLHSTGEAKLIVNAAGAGADWLRENAKDLSPEAFCIQGFQPYERLSEVMGSADVLIALLDSDAGQFAVPSKTLSYLCAGRPILMAAPAMNMAAKVILRANAGVVVCPDSHDGFVDAAKKLFNDSEQLMTYGENARFYAEQNFNIEHIADRFLGVMKDLKPSDAPLEDPVLA